MRHSFDQPTQSVFADDHYLMLTSAETRSFHSYRYFEQRTSFYYRCPRRDKNDTSKYTHTVTPFVVAPPFDIAPCGPTRTSFSCFTPPPFVIALGAITEGGVGENTGAGLQGHPFGAGFLTLLGGIYFLCFSVCTVGNLSTAPNEFSVHPRLTTIAPLPDPRQRVRVLRCSHPVRHRPPLLRMSSFTFALPPLGYRTVRSVTEELNFVSHPVQ